MLKILNVIEEMYCCTIVPKLYNLYLNKHVNRIPSLLLLHYSLTLLPIFSRSREI